MVKKEGTGGGLASEHMDALIGSSSLTNNLTEAVPASTSILALVSQHLPQKLQPLNSPSNVNGTQTHGSFKDKGREQDLRTSNCGHDDTAQHGQSSTSRSTVSVRDGHGISLSHDEEYVNALDGASSSTKSLTEVTPAPVHVLLNCGISQTTSPTTAQPSLAALVAPPGQAPVQSNVEVVAAITIPPELASADRGRRHQKGPISLSDQEHPASIRNRITPTRLLATDVQVGVGPGVRIVADPANVGGVAASAPALFGNAELAVTQASEEVIANTSALFVGAHDEDDAAMVVAPVAPARAPHDFDIEAGLLGTPFRRSQLNLGVVAAMVAPPGPALALEPYFDIEAGLSGPPLRRSEVGPFF